MKKAFERFLKVGERDSKSVLRLFFIGNFLVVFLSTIIISVVLSWNSVSRERERYKTSKRQLLHFLEYQQAAISEAMWLESYDAIRLKILLVAQQFGSKEFRMYLENENGECVYQSDEAGNKADQCELPADFASVRRSQTHGLLQKEGLGRYFYFTPLTVGERTKGHLYLVIDDPYQFYIGTIWGPALLIFLPNIVILLVLLMAWFFFSNRMILQPYLVKQLALERANAVNRITSQLAHDIRSPLAAFEIISSTLHELPENKRIIIRNSINRIRDLANSLLSNSMKPMNEGAIAPLPSTEVVEEAEEFVVALLDPIIEMMVTEKRIQYRDRLNVEIEYRKSNDSYGLFAKIQPNKLKRVLSNLINNSIEAMTGHSGKVEIILMESPDQPDRIEIQVKDNGKGIRADLISKVGTRGLTIDKENGSGLGLYHAINTIRSFGGNLNIESAESKGTTVRISLIHHPAPDWFVPEIVLKSGSTLMVFDDDVSVHQIWNKRIEDLGSVAGIRILNFSDPVEFQRFYGKNFTDLDQALFLMDYEINNSQTTGLDLIEILGLQNQSILVTSRYEETEIRQRCQKLGVKLIPKNLSGFIPMKINE